MNRVILGVLRIQSHSGYQTGIQGRTEVVETEIDVDTLLEEKWFRDSRFSMSSDQEIVSR